MILLTIYNNSPSQLQVQTLPLSLKVSPDLNIIISQRQNCFPATGEQCPSLAKPALFPLFFTLHLQCSSHLEML